MNREWSLPQLSPVVRVTARAADVGYFNTKFSLGRGGLGPAAGQVTTGLFPSLAPRLAHRHEIQSPGTATPDGCIAEIDGARYFVGAGAESRTTGHDARHVLRDYCLSNEYLALLRGALYYMALDAGATERLVIESLVLGLPLNTHHEYAAALRERALGDHFVCRADGTRSLRITVEAVQVIVQPQGALVNFNCRGGRSLRELTALVVDPGGGTLDWFLLVAGVPNWSRSGAYPASTLACAAAVADRIKPEWKDSLSIMRRIDEAIRTDAAAFTVAGRQYPLADHQGDIHAVLERAVTAMLASVGQVDELDHVLLTGGGAALFGRYLRQCCPDLAALIQVDEDPVFSNVRGFQIAAEMLHAARRTGATHEA